MEKGTYYSLVYWLFIIVTLLSYIFCIYSFINWFMSVNKVILVGNLVHDPRIVEFQNGGKNAQFALATNKKVVNNNNSTTEYVEYHNIVIPSKGLATVAEQYLKKGDKVYLEGELRTRKYEKDGITRSITEIYCNHLEMLSARKEPATNEHIPF